MQALAIRALFAATVFVAAGLVFLVQPLVAKQLLPAFGGTPAVWNTAVVFFQVVLLAGYALAHVSLRALGPRRQVFLQVGLALVTLAFLPFGLGDTSLPPQSVPPAAWIVGLLAVAVGVPYLAVASASPVLQRWYATLGRADSHDPYFLYVASNAGSLAGLLAFPFALEPLLATDAQERTWAIAFAVYLLGLACCAGMVRRSGIDRAPAAAPAGTAEPPAEHGAGRAVSSPPSRWHALRWVLLAAIPASLMLGATTYITTDVASAPMLWVVPLSLYLVSFMLTFGRRVRIAPGPGGVLAAGCAILLLFVELDLLDAERLATVVVHLAAMTSAAVLAHSLLYAERPAAEHLTGFYLYLSLGGAIGGSFTAIVAPAVFEGVYEYPLLLAAVFALRPPAWHGPRRWRSRVGWRAGSSVLELVIAAVLIAVLASAATGDAPIREGLDGDTVRVGAFAGFALLALRRWGLFVAGTSLLLLMTMSTGADAVHVERNFFGTLRVDRSGSTHRLLHGTTLHGTQFRDPGRRRVPTTYYTRPGPVGDIFERLQREAPFVEVGVVGLGTGTVLGHARLWQRFTFFEIDPAVIRVAQDPDLFSWLSGAQVDVRIVEGDARLQLRDVGDDRFDLLLLDAYSSDAVPVHLLTVEAFELYLDKLAPGAAMALHASSRHLELEPVVAANARRLGLAGVSRSDPGRTAEHLAADGTGSHWIVLARDERDLRHLLQAPGWRPLEGAEGTRPWTDDFSNVVGAIRWLP